MAWQLKITVWYMHEIPLYNLVFTIHRTMYWYINNKVTFSNMHRYVHDLVHHTDMDPMLNGIIHSVNKLRPRQYGRHFPDDIFKCIFLNENVGISIKISLNIVPRGPFNNIPALVQIMAWRRPGDKPLYEPMMVCLLTHICVTRPQWVKSN